MRAETKYLHIPIGLMKHIMDAERLASPHMYPIVQMYFVRVEMVTLDPAVAIIGLDEEGSEVPS